MQKVFFEVRKNIWKENIIIYNTILFHIKVKTDVFYKSEELKHICLCFAFWSALTAAASLNVLFFKKSEYYLQLLIGEIVFADEIL